MLRLLLVLARRCGRRRLLRLSLIVADASPQR
uniref:Uncharacterized protein n=1 Tax=Arundo donax TaxID=35708 RepID=A0A0A9AYU7_ARUDO